MTEALPEQRSTRYYAHTAEDAEGNRIADQSKWQLLADHLDLPLISLLKTP